MVVMLRHVFRSKPGRFHCSYEQDGKVCGMLLQDGIHRLKVAKKVFEGQEVEPEDVEAVPPVPALAAWDLFSAQVREKILEKSAGYGNAWQEQGYMGNLARILSKSSRLKNLAWGDTLEDPPGEETLFDTVEDMAALCAFFRTNLQSERRWGDESDDEDGSR